MKASISHALMKTPARDEAEEPRRRGPVMPLPLKGRRQRIVFEPLSEPDEDRSCRPRCLRCWPLLKVHVGTRYTLGHL
jgi:hypothetical protein